MLSQNDAISFLPFELKLQVSSHALIGAINRVLAVRLSKSIAIPFKFFHLLEILPNSLGLVRFLSVGALFEGLFVIFALCALRLPLVSFALLMCFAF